MGQMDEKMQIYVSMCHNQNIIHSYSISCKFRNFCTKYAAKGDKYNNTALYYIICTVKTCNHIEHLATSNCKISPQFHPYIQVGGVNICIVPILCKM